MSKRTRTSVTVPDAVKKHFKIGVNSTIRSLEAGKAECLLISADISPAFLAKHLISMALNRNPALIIAVATDLSSIFKQLFGVACCVCAGEDFPPELKALLQAATEEYAKPQHFQMKCNTAVAPMPEKRQPEPPVDFEKVYLRKPSNGSRAFEPQKTKSAPERNTKTWDEFISFNDYEKMDIDTDEESLDKEETIESTVIQLKDLNLPSLKESVAALGVKKKKKRKKTKADQSEVKYVSAVARKIYGNPQKKKKKKQN
jgi:ribosomal protein L7Ae-like RNA K-turn-binding protein